MKKIAGKNCVMVSDHISKKTLIITGKEAVKLSEYVSGLK